MNPTILQRSQILDAAEQALRRHGPTKTTVLDVSRALGVSHGSVYRHFSSKAELKEAVTERWLTRIIEPLGEVLVEDGPAITRLRRWFDALTASKRRLATEDPELFSTYVGLMNDSPDMVKRHVDALLVQLTVLVAEGIEHGEVDATNPADTARAVFQAMSRFHNPVNVAFWSDPDLLDHYEGVWALVVRGLRPTADRLGSGPLNESA